MDMAQSRQEIIDRCIAGKDAAYTQPDRLKGELAFQFLAPQDDLAAAIGSPYLVQLRQFDSRQRVNHQHVRPGGLQALERTGQTISACGQFKIRVGAEDRGQPLGDKR